LTERQKFLILIKILFHFLEKHQDEGRLKSQAKRVVAECTRRNRRGDFDYVPLQAAMERRLRQTVGDVYWMRAKDCVERYCQRRSYVSTNANLALLSI
jgi:hypothetical protein